jgi:outer membrane protein assembly complex protein YaeT
VSAAILARPDSARADVTDYLGRRLVDVRVEVNGADVADRSVLELVETRLGEPLAMEAVRDTIDHLTGLGRFDDIRVYAEPGAAAGVVLRWALVPVQRIGRITFSGSPRLSESELRATIADRSGRALSPARVPAIVDLLHTHYSDRGYRSAVITPRIRPGDAAAEAELALAIEAGPRTLISAVTLRGNLPASEAEILSQLNLRRGDPYDRPTIDRRIDDYEERLRELGYYEAEVDHGALFAEDGATATLNIAIEPGPRVRVVFQGDPLSEDRRESLVPIRAERSVEEDLLEDSSRNIERYLRDEGYREAAVRYERREERGELVLTFTVRRGPLHRVSSVELVGVQSLARSAIEPLLQLETGQPFVEERAATIASAVTELYRVEGFTSASVELDLVIPPAVSPEGPPERPVAVRFIVNEGLRTIVDEVTIEGAVAIAHARIRPLLGLTEGRPLYRPQLAADRDAVERLYRNEGFKQAVVDAQPAITDAGRRLEPSSERDPVIRRAVIRWVIREGPQTLVDHVLITGNTRTRREVIQREIALVPGEALGEDAMVESQRRLSALGLFRRVRITELLHDLGPSRDVIVEVEEAPSTTMSYGGGLEVGRRTRRADDGTADERIDVAPRGFFEIGRRNLWGKNRTLSVFTRVSLRSRDPAVDSTDPADTGGYGLNEYRVVGTYREPRAFGRPGDVQLTGFIEQAIRSSFSFRRQGVRTEYARRLAQMFTVSGRYTLDRTELFDEQIAPEDQPLIDRLFPQVRLSTFTGTVLRDSRNDVLDPERGTVVGIDGSLAARALGSEVGFLRSFLQGFYYRRLPGTARLVLVTGARLGVARGFIRDVEVIDENGDPVLGPGGQPLTEQVKDLPASERFYAGGDTTVRGFALDRLGTDETLDENGFPTGGNGLIVLNVEVRAPYWKGLSLVGFVDAGNVWKLATDIDLTDLRTAAGFGVRYRSPLGPLRVDLGFKLDPRTLASGSRERAAILHISLGQAF